MVGPTYFVAFSGHRPENRPGRSEVDLALTIPRLEKTLRALREKAARIHGEIHLVSSLAAGADIIACETAIKLSIPVHIVLPKSEHDFLQSFHHKTPENDLSQWLPRAMAILATIRAHPDFPEIPLNPRHTMRNSAVSATSPECYAEANTRLLEPADLLLTISTLEPSKSIAGTTHLIGQANAIGIPAMNINPADPPGTSIPAIPLSFADPHCESLAPFANIQQAITTARSATTSPFVALARYLSTAADQSARWFRRASALAITFHLLATILAAAVAAFYYALKSGKIPGFTSDSSSAYWLLAGLALVELLLVGAGWWIERRLHKDKAQQTWLHCRFARELMRSMEKSNPFLDPLFPEIQRHQPAWKRFAITTALMLRAEQPVPAYPSLEQISTWRDQYLEGRVKDQESFFSRKSHEAKIPHRRFHILTHWSGLIAVAIVAIAFLVKAADLVLPELFQKPRLSSSHYIPSAIFLLFLPILMPLLASIGASFGAVFDYGRRSARYEEMAKGLSTAARLLPALATLPDIANTVRHTEETLQDELIEWFAAQKKGLGH